MGWLGPRRERGTALEGNKERREAHQLTGRSNCDSPRSYKKHSLAGPSPRRVCTICTEWRSKERKKKNQNQKNPETEWTYLLTTSFHLPLLSPPWSWLGLTLWFRGGRTHWSWMQLLADSQRHFLRDPLLHQERNSAFRFSPQQQILCFMPL
ncbi:uncharacterized protein LOC144381564 [Halichoerus grypus]